MTKPGIQISFSTLHFDCIEWGLFFWGGGGGGVALKCEALQLIQLYCLCVEKFAFWLVI